MQARAVRRRSVRRLTPRLACCRSPPPPQASARPGWMRWFFLVCLAGQVAAAARTLRPTAMTTTGPVVGETQNGVDGYLGIPFAAPPTGALRFAPPVRSHCVTICLPLRCALADRPHIPRGQPRGTPQRLGSTVSRAAARGLSDTAAHFVWITATSRTDVAAVCAAASAAAHFRAQQTRLPAATNVPMSPHRRHRL